MVNGNGLKPWYSQSETLLLAENLRKTYGARVALRKLSFTLQAGHVMGFLGPNGAGKTTSIRILTTMLEPTSGRFLVDGISSENPEKIRQVIGVLPEGQGFPKHITGLEYLIYFAQLYGRSRSEAKKIGVALLQDVGMPQRGSALIGTYSHGMRQRLGIARALVNDPKVIFLDEPTLGLDPRGQHELLALIQRVARERNTGVILSSHLLSEIEGICDDVIIMNAGRGCRARHGGRSHRADPADHEPAQCPPHSRPGAVAAAGPTNCGGAAGGSAGDGGRRDRGLADAGARGAHGHR